MDTQKQLIDYLKQHGPSTVKELTQVLSVSENAVRHHLNALERGGWLCQERQAGKVGRPAVRYGLTVASEGLFPKRYPELLDAVLSQAEAEGLIERLLEGVAERMACELRAKLEGLEGEAKLAALLALLDYGDMLGVLEKTETGWELRAYNCLYYATGQKFVQVCDLPPKVIAKATGLESGRPFCQRDGQRACHFLIYERGK